MSKNILPKIDTITLDNGMKIVAIDLNNNTDVVTVNIFYDVGSYDESIGKTGIAHMLEHMNFKSTKHLKAGEFDKIVKNFGGVNNASTGFDQTQYYIQCSSEHMNKSVSLFAELMENLQFNNDEFQKERNVVAEERRLRTDNSPMGYLYFKLFNALYDYNSYHHTPIGFMKDIQSYTIDDLKEFHDKYYSPANATLVVAGDIRASEVFKSAKKYFKNIKNKKKIENRKNTKNEIEKTVKHQIIYKQSTTQLVAIAFKNENFRHKSQVPLEVLADILTGGKSSILTKDLVEKKKLVSSISAFNMPLKHSGVFIIIANCSEGVDGNKVQKEIFKILNSIKKRGVSEKSLLKVKKTLKIDFMKSFLDSASTSDLIGEYYTKGDITVLEDFENILNHTSKQDIKDVLDTYFNYPTTIILKSEKK